MRISIILLILTQWRWTNSIAVCGSVSDDANFIYEKFPLQSSMRAIIEVDVYYPYYKYLNNWFFPILGIYTTKDHINIRSKCTHNQYGQIRNENLHPGITVDPSGVRSRTLNCENDNTTNMIHCTGNIIVQDFEPRHFSFSFGFHCAFGCFDCSLRGLDYKLRIYAQRNETNCVELSLDSAKVCYRYSRYGVFPNLVSDPNLKDLSFHYLSGYSPLCYQQAIRFLCYLYLPKCDPVSKRIILACREMCYEYLNECNHLIVNDFDCDYLLPYGGNIPCFYHLVYCPEPPTVEYARVGRRNNTAHYFCREGFMLEGNKTITCNLTEGWPTPPECLLIEGTATLLASLLSVFVLVILIVIIMLICIIKFNKKQIHGIIIFQMQVDVKEMDEPLKAFRRKEVQRVSAIYMKRNREFDSFVLYHFDTDDDFVISHLLPELEEVRNFKLHIHSRDFTPGCDIKDNIEEAIEGSNSAIIVMSQGFVDSMWCKEEFTHCYIENMKDAAFNLCVIMMQPVDTLINISDYMKTFFDTRTYLQINDPGILIKLAIYLKKGRDSEEEDSENAINKNRQGISVKCQPPAVLHREQV